jgi:hypothetical protein
MHMMTRFFLHSQTSPRYDLRGALAHLDWQPKSNSFARQYTIPVSATPKQTTSDTQPTFHCVTAREINWLCVKIPERMLLRLCLDDIRRMRGHMFTFDATCSRSGADK